jgi:queuine tRNA-ribosyltransferase
MTFNLIKKSENGIRIGTLLTPHGTLLTPFFMPVGTVGSVKTMAPRELEKMGAQIVLSNTYHLYLRPGEKLIKELGGLHSFMGWDKPILTDSGGYQVFSLARGNNHNKSGHSEQSEESFVQDSRLRGNDKTMPINDSKGLVKITEEGVTFQSHLDGSKHLFTPEKVIDIQLDLGVDILMPLDVCPAGNATEKQIREAVELTIRWAKRAKEHFDSRMVTFCHSESQRRISGDPSSLMAAIQDDNVKRPMLHGIVQGGLDLELRQYCANELIKLDFDGYSVGGLAVDIETRAMWDVVKLMGEILPENKQRYLMGVGTPDDIIHAVTLGMDMFDCVLPTRLARHANVYVKNNTEIDLASDANYKLVNLLKSEYRTDPDMLDPSCGCDACQMGKGFSKAYISHLLRTNEILGLRLATSHNLWQYLDLMKELSDNK